MRYNTNKYSAIKTNSALCGREFASKAEAARGEELYMMQQAGIISDLEYQIPFTLFEKPKITITIDFRYKENGRVIYEDSKGILTRDARTKLCWLKDKYGIDVRLIKKSGESRPITLPREKRAIIEGGQEICSI